MAGVMSNLWSSLLNASSRLLYPESLLWSWAKLFFESTSPLLRSISIFVIGYPISEAEVDVPHASQVSSFLLVLPVAIVCCLAGELEVVANRAQTILPQDLLADSLRLEVVRCDEAAGLLDFVVDVTAEVLARALVCCPL